MRHRWCDSIAAPIIILQSIVLQSMIIENTIT
jgi:hypothetical protein